MDTQALDRVQRLLEGALAVAEPVVVAFLQRVHADRDTLHPGVHQGADARVGQAGAVGAHHHGRAAYRGPFGQSLQVVPEQRLPAGKDEEGRSVYRE